MERGPLSPWPLTGYSRSSSSFVRLPDGGLHTGREGGGCGSKAKRPLSPFFAFSLFWRFRVLLPGRTLIAYRSLVCGHGPAQDPFRPVLLDQHLHLGDDLGLSRIVCHVVELLGVGVVVVELGAAAAVVPLGVAPALGA